MFFGCRNNFIALAKLVLIKKTKLRSAMQTSFDNVEEINSFVDI